MDFDMEKSSFDATLCKYEILYVYKYMSQVQNIPHYLWNIHECIENSNSLYYREHKKLKKNYVRTSTSGTIEILRYYK